MKKPAVQLFQASDGYQFHYRHWRTEEKRPTGYIVGLHGIQSHSGWYEYSSTRLCEAGYEVCFLDRRGSGLNQQDRGHATHADRLIQDVVQFLEEIRYRRDRIAPQSPLILMSVSWGGRLAASVATKRAELIDALVLLYPGIHSQIKPTWFQSLQLRLALQLGLWEKLVPIPLQDPTLFTSDPESQTMILNDSLALHQVTISFLSASSELQRLAVELAPQIVCPALLMLAGRDRIINNPATREWFQMLAHQEKKMVEYSAAEHTLEFETQREQFLEDLIGWLNRLQNVKPSRRKHF